MGSGQRCARPASPSSRGGVIPLDDVGGDSAAVAQLDRVAGATDPGPEGLIRRAAAEIVVEGNGYLRPVVASVRVMGHLQSADYLSCRDYATPRPPLASAGCSGELNGEPTSAAVRPR